MNPEPLLELIEYFDKIDGNNIKQWQASYNNDGHGNMCGCFGAHTAYFYGVARGNTGDYDRGRGKLSRRIGTTHLSTMLTECGASVRGAFGSKPWRYHPKNVLRTLYDKIKSGEFDEYA